MATSKERDKEQGKGHFAMKTPPIVSQQKSMIFHDNCRFCNKIVIPTGA